MTKAVARVVMLPMYDSADTTALKTGLTPTCLVSKDGAGFVAATNAAAEVGTSGVYALTLTAAEMDADLVVVKVTAAGACDQVATLVTDDLAYIRAKTDTIGALAVTVQSPVAAGGAITIQAGDDYSASHGRSLDILVTDATHALGLDNVAAEVSLKCTQATWTGTAVSTAAGYTVTFEPTAAQTAALTISRQSYELEATLADGDVVTLATGTISVVGDIPAVAP